MLNQTPPHSLKEKTTQLDLSDLNPKPTTTNPTSTTPPAIKEVKITVPNQSVKGIIKNPKSTLPPVPKKQSFYREPIVPASTSRRSLVNTPVMPHYNDKIIDRTKDRSFSGNGTPMRLVDNKRDRQGLKIKSGPGRPNEIKRISPQPVNNHINSNRINNKNKTNSTFNTPVGPSVTPTPDTPQKTNAASATTSTNLNQNLPKPEKIKNKKQKKLLTGLYDPCYNPLSHMRNLSRYQNSLKSYGIGQGQGQMSANDETKNSNTKTKLDEAISKMDKSRLFGNLTSANASVPPSSTPTLKEKSRENQININKNLVLKDMSSLISSVKKSCAMNAEFRPSAKPSEPNKLYLDPSEESYDLKKLIFNEFENCKLDKNSIMPRLLHPDVKLLGRLNNYKRKAMILEQDLDTASIFGVGSSSGSGGVIGLGTSTPTNSPPYNINQAIESAINFRKNNPATSKPNSIETVIPKSTFAPLTQLKHDDIKHLTLADKSKQVIQILSSYCSKVDLVKLKGEQAGAEQKKKESSSSRKADERGVKGKKNEVLDLVWVLIVNSRLF